MSTLKTYAKTIALAALWALTLALLVLSLGWIPPARAEVIDGVIESDPEHARFMTGLVIWARASCAPRSSSRRGARSRPIPGS